MPLLGASRAFERILKESTSSSHFVWLYAGIEFFESTQGWLFGFRRQGQTLLIALEPLPPTGALEQDVDFAVAWSELDVYFAELTLGWVGLPGAYVSRLRELGFQLLQVGSEPWFALLSHLPTGKSGRGVRAARNQAIRGGVRVEECRGQQVKHDLNLHAEIKAVFRDWRDSSLVSIEGFLQTNAPLAFAECRRYFFARTSARLEGYLIASPIAGRNGFYLEDMILRPDSVRGTGELLTSEAMSVLGQEGVAWASMGVVTLKKLAVDSVAPPPTPIRLLVQLVALFRRFFYNSEGVELYRKRFQPKLWEDVFLAVKAPPSGSFRQTRAWLQVIAGLVQAFDIRFRFSFKSLLSWLVGPVLKYPVTSVWLALQGVLFFALNRGGLLNEGNLLRFGFFPNAPLAEWRYRSITSDILCYDLRHYLTLLTLSLILLPQVEKKQGHFRMLAVLVGAWIFDDPTNFFLILKPLQFLNPALYLQLSAGPEVGSSLILAVFFGLGIHQFRAHRNVLLAVTVLLATFGIALASTKVETVLFHLNHLVFFILGYLVGSVFLEFDRRQSRRVSKFPTPVMIKNPLRTQTKGPAKGFSLLHDT